MKVLTEGKSGPPYGQRERKLSDPSKKTLNIKYCINSICPLHLPQKMKYDLNMCFRFHADLT
jgi:hypothetical protein